MCEERPASRCYEMRLLARELEANEAYRVHADVLCHAADEIEELMHRLAGVTVHRTLCRSQLRKAVRENELLRELAGDAIRALENIHCNNYDMCYCNEECPYSIGEDICTVTKLMDRSKELGARFYVFDEEGEA